MTTKETPFNRDSHPFEELTRSILPELVETRWRARRQSEFAKPRLRVWSAAASTGQEAYSVCMSITDYLREASRWKAGELPSAEDFEILATDISDQALNLARAGVDRPFDVFRGLSETQRRTYFDPDGANWKISDSLRRMVQFRRLNLIQPFNGMMSFDLILCRNVLIYFDEPTRTNICRQLAASLYPGGLLMLGSSESLPPDITTLQRKTFRQTITYQ